HPSQLGNSFGYSFQLAQAEPTTPKQRYKNPKAHEPMLAHHLKIHTVGTGVFESRSILFEKTGSESIKAASRKWIIFGQDKGVVPGIQPSLGRVVQVSMYELAHAVHPSLRSERDDQQRRTDQQCDTQRLVA